MMERRAAIAEAPLRRRYFFKLLANLLGLAVGLITQSIVPRSLGPAAYGNFSFLTTFFWQVIGFLNLNASTAFYTKLSQRQDDQGLVRFYLLVLLAISVAVTIIIGLIYSLGKAGTVWPDQVALFVVLAAGYGLLKLYGDTLTQISDACGLTTRSERINMILKVFGVAILLVLFYGGWLDLSSYFVFQIFMLAAAVLVLAKMIQRYKPCLIIGGAMLTRQAARVYLAEFAAFSLPLVVFSFFAILEQLLDRWFLQRFSGSAQQGFYSLAYQIGAICFLFVSAMIPLFMRECAVAHANNDLPRMRYLFSKYSRMLFAIAAFFGCFLAVEAGHVIQLFGGHAFVGAFLPVAIMAFFPIHQTYGQVNASFFFATARTRTYSRIGLGLIVIGLPMTFFVLGPRAYGALEAGAVGLAMKMVLLQLISVNIQLWFNAKYLGLPFLRFLLHQVTVVALFGLIAWACSITVSLIFKQAHFLVQFLVSGTLYSFLVGGLVLWFPAMGALESGEIAAALAWLRQIGSAKFRTGM